MGHSGTAVPTVSMEANNLMAETMQGFLWRTIHQIIPESGIRARIDAAISEDFNHDFWRPHSKRNWLFRAKVLGISSSHKVIETLRSNGIGVDCDAQRQEYFFWIKGEGERDTSQWLVK